MSKGIGKLLEIFENLDDNITYSKNDILKLKESLVSKRSRKNCDYNAFELIFTIVICNYTTNKITNYTSILTFPYNEYKHILEISEDKFNKYMDDLRTRKRQVVDSWIANISIEGIFSKQQIKKVYLEGKNCVNPTILNLNDDYIDTDRADVYVELNDNRFIGFSIKQNTKCTLTNYSVEKIIKENPIKGPHLQPLNKIRKDLCDNAGINNTNYKENRDKANRLFYDASSGENPYWNSVRETLKVDNDYIKKRLVEKIYPVNSPYDIYNYDGTSMIKLNVDVDNDTINLYENFDNYTMDGGEQRNAAKMFYKLEVNGKIMNIELRWKGNILNASPQVQTFCE